ncbi:MAG: glycine--tRNA ligase subunit beta [Pseudomonadota bacterium]
MPDLLLELFSEEIPARMQSRATQDLQRLITGHLAEAGLSHGAGRAVATPRRLTLALADLPEMTPERVEERKGPRVDAPEKALEGFLRSTGLRKDDLVARDDKKGQVWFATITTPGRPAEEIVAEAVEQAVRNFPWPKSMRWGTGALRWVRPLHQILCILHDVTGHRAVPIDIDGITSGDRTEGHRFLAPEPFQVSNFDDYQAGLKKAFVMLDPADRADKIARDATALADGVGAQLIEDNGLLAEVAGLVEWPVVLMGQIDDQFRDLPPEVLRKSMREHQKFFSVRSNDGRIERFITVANTVTDDDGATILQGNGKVLTARLSDAKFFWENDLRTVRDGGMAALAEPLKQVTFHNKLGSQWERIERIAALARDLAPAVGADPNAAVQAARVAKADLSSEMVYEFPELQGVMGRYYAQHAGLSAEISNACQAHYAPLGPSDDVPTEPVSIAVSLAEKLDILIGFWAIDEKPTGSKDPFALRRAALGVIRTVLENGLRLRLADAAQKHELQVVADLPTEMGQLVKSAVESLPGGKDAMESARNSPFGEMLEELFLQDKLSQFDSKIPDLLGFFADRLKIYLRDQGVRHDVIQACFDLGGQDDLVLLVNRVHALQTFLGTEDGANLLAGQKRANNILTIEEKKDGVEYSGAPDVKFAEQEEERALFQALYLAEPAIAQAIEKEDFSSAMAQMATLRAPIDLFFDKVTVNAENGIVRRNRLCLLNRIREVMNQVARWDAIEG